MKLCGYAPQINFDKILFQEYLPLTQTIIPAEFIVSHFLEILYKRVNIKRAC